MIQEISTRLLKQLEEDLEQTCFQIKDPFQRWTTVLKLTREALKSLRTHFSDLKFKEKSEEIPIFKYIKPAFYQWQIYYTELYNIETNLPTGNVKKQAGFLERELFYIERFFRQYAFLYQYFKLNATELDNLYFVRGAETQSILLPEVPDLDPQFSTSCDYLFSKFKAFEMLREYLTGALRALNSDVTNSLNETNGPKLKWTGDKVNLVEIIYALYFTGQLDNGNADISQIIQFMENHLQIDLSRAYRDFIDIRNRKVSSPTRFIDQMRESIHKRIDEDLAFKKSERQRLRSGS